MTAAQQPILNILLCLMPALALFLFRKHLHLGVVRIMGNHYDLSPLPPRTPAHALTRTTPIAHPRLSTTNQLPPKQPPAEQPQLRAVSGTSGKCTAKGLRREAGEGVRTKAVQLEEGSETVQRRVDELRKICRRNHKTHPLEFFWAPEDDIPIVKVLRD